MSLVDAFEPTPLSPSMTGVLIVPKWDEGDDRHEWNKDDPTSVEIARKSFVDYKAKGYRLYRVDPKSGEKGELLKEFDPSAEKMVMLPPLKGG